MIHDVKTKQLKVIPDERGWMMEILRRDDAMFQGFGQVYMTTAYPGVVKGWHYHKKQYDYFTCISGMMKLVLYDARKESPTHGEINEFFVGVHNPLVVRIPPYVYHGFKGISTQEAVIINVVTECYDPKNPDEFRAAPHSGEVPYDWSRKDG